MSTAELVNQRNGKDAILVELLRQMGYEYKIVHVLCQNGENMDGVYLDRKPKSSNESCNYTWTGERNQSERLNESDDPDDSESFYESDDPEEPESTAEFQLSAHEGKRLLKMQADGRLKPRQERYSHRPPGDEEGELAYCDEEKRDAKNHKCLRESWRNFHLNFEKCLRRTERRGIKGAQYIRPQYKQVVLGTTFEHCWDEIHDHDRNDVDLVCTLGSVHLVGRVDQSLGK